MNGFSLHIEPPSYRQLKLGQDHFCPGSSEPLVIFAKLVLKSPGLAKIISFDYCSLLNMIDTAC